MQFLAGRWIFDQITIRGLDPVNNKNVGRRNNLDNTELGRIRRAWAALCRQFGVDARDRL